MSMLQLRESKLTEEVLLVASREGIEANDILEEAVRNYLHEYEVKRIRAESKVWYNLPADIRNLYRGRFVAVYNGEIVADDSDRVVLYKRMREKYGNQPVLMVEGGDHPMPEYRVTNVFSA